MWRRASANSSASSDSYMCYMKTTYYFKVSLLPTGNELLSMLVVAQLVKNPPIMQETWVWSLGWEDPLEKGMTTHSSILAWSIPWTLKSMGSQRVGHNWVTSTFTFHFHSFNATSSSCISILLSPFCLTSEVIISLAYAYYRWLYCCSVSKLCPNLLQPCGLLACQMPLSMGFSRAKFWSGLPFPSPEDPPDPAIELVSPAMAGGFFTTEPPGKPRGDYIYLFILQKTKFGFLCFSLPAAFLTIFSINREDNFSFYF